MADKTSCDAQYLIFALMPMAWKKSFAQQVLINARI